MFFLDMRPKFKYDYTYEKEFFKRNFHLYIARAKDDSRTEWTLWAVPVKCWNDPEHHKKEPIYLGRWKDGHVEMAKDHYEQEWSIQQYSKVLFEQMSEYMRSEVKQGAC